MGLQVVGDSCRTEWTFVQKQCSFVSPWPLEACWGLALASSRSAYTAASFPGLLQYRSHQKALQGGLCGVGFSEDGRVMESLSLIPKVIVFLS